MKIESRPFLFLFPFSELKYPSYVYHPINALHLLKRTSTMMPKLIRKNPKIQFNYNFTELREDYSRAYHGLADINEYFQINLKKFAYGYFKGK